MKKFLIGTVISTKMEKTVVVNVERKFRHPLYRKVITRHKNIQAHNDVAGIKEGDMVSISQIRPMSKNKHFKVVQKEIKLS